MIPLFIVISAPSGAGKTTLCDMLLQSYPELTYSISCTTRPPRIDEEDGEDYHFLTPERFQELLAQNSFIEHAIVHDNYYGTLREPIESAMQQGECVLLDIDVAGASQIRQYVKTLPPTHPMRCGFIDIFITVPSLAELERRLRGRGTDSDGVIARRIANATKEIARAPEYIYQVVNDDLEMAYRKLCDIINVKAGFA